jgi:hypothetical protein
MVSLPFSKTAASTARFIRTRLAASQLAQSPFRSAAVEEQAVAAGQAGVFAGERSRRATRRATVVLP